MENRRKPSQLPQPTKMPVTSKQEDIYSRPKLATLDNNCRQQAQLPCKPTARVLPARKEKKLTTTSTTSRNNQDTTTTRTTLTRRQPVGRENKTQATAIGRKVTSTEQESGTVQEKLEPKPAHKKTSEASTLHTASVSTTTSQHTSLVSRNTRLGGDTTFPTKNQQPLKDCHSLLPDNIADFDTDQEPSDPQQCGEYIQDIYQSLLRAEKEEVFKITPDLMCRQMEVEASHRRVLIDWLVQVHLQFNLLADTLHISMDILDRYLQVRTLEHRASFLLTVFSFPLSQLVDVPRKELQLVGVTAMFLAAKYEEIYPHSIAEFAYISADTYTTQQMRKKECDILRRLNYQLGKPTPLTFLRRYSKLMNTTTKIHNLAKYFIEVLYIFTDGRALLPSQCAVGAVILATRVTTNRGKVADIWSPFMEQHTWYSHKRAAIFTDRVLNCVLSYLHLCSKESRFSTIRDKYSNDFQGVASFPRLYSLLELIAKKKLV